MSDIVEWLRASYARTTVIDVKRLDEAADRIEQLEAALKPLCCTCDRAASDECSRAEVNCAFWNARAVLEDKA